MQQGVNDVGIETRYEFNEVTLLSSFAVGTPGKRTFFLLIGRKEKWVRVWLEKEQLETLALAIDQFLLTLSQMLDFCSKPSLSLLSFLICPQCGV